MLRYLFISTKWHSTSHLKLCNYVSSVLKTMTKFDALVQIDFGSRRSVVT